MKVNLMLLTRILEKLGCVVTAACNGLEAIDHIAEHDYDIVFMDCQMPDMGGFHATRHVPSK